MRASFALFLLVMMALQCLMGLPLLRALRGRPRGERRAGLIAIAGLAALPWLLASLLLGGLATLWFWRWGSPAGLVSLASFALIVLAAVNGLVALFRRAPRPPPSPE